MSLQVWLPLIKDYKNYGLHTMQFSLASSNTSQQSNGKIGPTCYYNDSYTAGGLISNQPIDLGTNLSMFCWMNFSSVYSSSSLMAVGGQHRYPANTGMGITIKYNNSTSGYLSLNTGNGSNRTFNTYCGSTLLTANTWYHVGFTYDGSTIKLYVNGKLDGTHSYSGQKNIEDYIAIFNWSFNSGSVDQSLHSNYKFHGYLNDFRIYDHTLSAKEVKEISKGLVAHYPLTPINQNNLAKNTGFSIYNNHGVAASIVTTGEQFLGYPVYRLTMTSNGAADWLDTLWSHGVYQSGYTFSANTKYCYWIYYRPVSHNNVRVGGVASNIGGWTEIAPHYFGDGWYRVGQYRDGSVTVDKSDAIFTSFYTPSATSGVQVTIDFCAPHLIVGTSNIIETFDATTPSASKITDASGYGNDLTITGTLAASSNSPRYRGCIDFNQTGYLKKTDFNMTTQQFTIAFWLNPPYTINAQHFICGTFNSWTANGFGMWRDSTGGGYSLLYRSNSEGSHTGLPAIGPAHDAWNHIAIVYTGRQGITYLNGIEVTRVDGGSGGVVQHPVLYLGNSRFNETTSQTDEACMSDFRFYSTALTAEDIAELYKTGASLAKNGTLFAYNFSEFDQTKKSNINKDGTVSSCNLSTKSMPTYDMKLQTLDDGSTWARIHYLDVTNDKTFYANTTTEVQTCTDKANRYSRMGIVDQFKSSPSLPTGYTELEYIQSSGTQQIDTGVSPDSDLEVEIAFTPTGGLTENAIFGSSWSASGYFLMFYQNKIRWHSGGTSVDIGSYSAGNRVVCHCANTYITVNSVKYNIAGGTNSAANIVLLGDMGYNANKKGIGKIEYVKMWKNSALIRSFVPCKNPSGTVGLYDLVEKKFYSNSGSGSFTAGTFVSKYEFLLTYPSKYTRLKYIESTGTQYINTGITNSGSSTYMLKMKYEFTTTSPANQIMGFTGNRGMGIGTENATWWECSHPSSVTANTLYNVKWTINNSSGAYNRAINGYSNKGSGGGNSGYGGNLYLFAAHVSASTSGFSPTYYCHSRLYEAQIYVNGRLERDYIPCKTRDGQVGLYDRVTNQFYANNGSGNFTAGPSEGPLLVYNRWTQTSSPNATSVTGYAPISIAWPDHSAGIRKHGSVCAYNCDSGDTWYAPIGQRAAWNDGIPAADGNMELSTELWVRVDKSAYANSLNVQNGSITATNYIEF